MKEDLTPPDIVNYEYTSESPVIRDMEVLEDIEEGGGVRALRREFDYQVGKERRNLVRALMRMATGGNIKALTTVFQMAKPEDQETMMKTVVQGVRLQIGAGADMRFIPIDPEEEAERARVARKEGTAK